MPVRVQLPDLEHWKAQVKCQAGCPVATDAGRYVQLIAEGRDEEAYLVARAPNPFASVCGRVCAAPCEDACRRGAIDAPISIRALKRYVTEQYGVESIRPDTQDRLRDDRRRRGQPLRRAPAGAIRARTPPAPARGRGARSRSIGAGPAGLAAAHDLALLGYDVTVFEAAAEPGGMMRFGIPEYRLPRTLIRAEIDKIVVARRRRCSSSTPLVAGVRPRRAARAGLRGRLPLGRRLARAATCRCPGVELDGVVKAVDYLLNVNRGYRMDLAAGWW